MLSSGLLEYYMTMRHFPTSLYRLALLAACLLSCFHVHSTDMCFLVRCLSLPHKMSAALGKDFAPSSALSQYLDQRLARSSE